MIRNACGIEDRLGRRSLIETHDSSSRKGIVGHRGEPFSTGLLPRSGYISWPGVTGRYPGGLLLRARPDPHRHERRMTMPTRDEFLHAIRAAPHDLALRLVFADWLEEQGDPLADFIRLQFQLEPFRDVHDHDAKQARYREWEVIWDHRHEWLGPLAELIHEYGDSPFVFRHGFVEAVELSATELLEHADRLQEWCPALHEATLFDVRDHGLDLAGCAAL